MIVCSICASDILNSHMYHMQARRVVYNHPHSMFSRLEGMVDSLSEVSALFVAEMKHNSVHRKYNYISSKQKHIIKGQRYSSFLCLDSLTAAIFSVIGAICFQKFCHCSLTLNHHSEDISSFRALP